MHERPVVRSLHMVPSRHMRRCMEQGAFALDPVAFIRAYGPPLCRTGIDLVVLPHRAAPAEDHRNARLGVKIPLESNDAWRSPPTAAATRFITPTRRCHPGRVPAA